MKVKCNKAEERCGLCYHAVPHEPSPMQCPEDKDSLCYKLDTAVRCIPINNDPFEST